MSAITMVSPQHASKKPCTSASCCSPSRLWRNIQLLINGNQREEFRKLVSDTNKLPHIVRVILTQRLSNTNSSSRYGKPVPIDQRLLDKFGKTLSATANDVNALELALLQRHDHIAYAILMVLKKNTTPAEVKQFLNHQWGKEKLTALHLAAFWGMSKLVRLLLDLGADPFVQNHLELRPIDCTTHSDTINILKEQQQQKSQQQPVIKKRPSLLLKKAEKSMMRPSAIVDFNSTPTFVVPLDNNDRAPTMSPLSFSSSSSSSSFSSLSSFEYHWTPPTSPVPYQFEEVHPPSPSPLTAIVLQQQFAQVKIADSPSPSPVPTPVVAEEEEVEHQQPERPGCFPRHSISSNIESTSNNDGKQQGVVSQKQKKVHFCPQTILMDACIRGDREELMEVIADHNDALQLDKIRDAQNRSLLHIAILYGQEDIAEYLANKIDVNYIDNDGNNEILKKLIVRCANRLMF